MAAAALVLYGVYLALTFGVRVALQVRRTGSTGVHGLPANAGPLERLAGSLFVFSLLAGVAAPALTLAGVLDPVPALDGMVGNTIGFLLTAAGILLTFGAQLAMGDAWRIGVDPEERTRLVTDGPFRLVRNPIYSALIPTVLGLLLMVPNAMALIGFACILISIELQVRLVEEPHLLKTFGKSYADYAASVGRFVPGVGLLHGA
ncbi:MAG TPA: isoprenylcysteine carboxylmethyltransferase family protein [Solirubrobacterales bacterium]